MASPLPGARRRLEPHKIAANQERLCEVPGCGLRRQGLGRYCHQHDDTATRTGHPLGKNLRPSMLQPYADRVREFLEKHRDHPGIVAGIAWSASLIDSGQIGRRPTGKRPPAVYLRWHLGRIKAIAVDPREVLVRTAAMYLWREFSPRTFADDRHWRHQLARMVFRLASTRRSDTGSIETPHPSVRTRELLADRLTGALGVLSLRIAREVMRGLEREPEPTPRETPVEGSSAAFEGHHHDTSAKTKKGTKQHG